jgi:regulatory protein
VPRRKPAAPLDREALLAYALRALSSRALTISELRDKLCRRAVEASDVEHVITRLKELRYLDDRRFAEAFAAARKENQGFGRMRVITELRRRRVSPAVANAAVERTFQDADEIEMIEQYLQRKYRGVDLAEYLRDPRRLASVYRRLRVAGFSSGASIRVLKRFDARADELEMPEEEGST